MFDFLSQTLTSLESDHSALRCGTASGRCCLAEISLEHIVIGVGGPELLEELLLRNVALPVFIESLKEHLDFLVGQGDLEANQSVLQFFQRYCTRVVIIYEPEAFLYRYVVSAEVFTNLPENSPLPLNRELLLYIRSNQ